MSEAISNLTMTTAAGNAVGRKTASSPTRPARAEILERMQELDLARAARAGDASAMDSLVLSFEPSTRAMALQSWISCGGGVDLDDLIQTGRESLLVAISKFDPDHGNGLSAFARHEIRGGLNLAVMNFHGQMRVGTNISDKKAFYRLRKERSALEGRLRRPMEDTDFPEIAGRIGVPESVVRRMFPRVFNQDISKDTGFDGGQFKGDGDSTDAMENVKAVELGLVHPSDEIQVLSERDLERMLGRLPELLATLGERERAVLRARFVERRELADIGAEHSVTKERVRQIERKALRILRAEAELRGLLREDLPERA